MRRPEHEINPLILNRYSSRSMSGEEILEEELMSLFEAAKWAPSSMNTQGWRFVYAKKNTKYFMLLFLLFLTYLMSGAFDSEGLPVILFIYQKLKKFK